MSSGEAFQFAIDSDAEELKLFVNNAQKGTTLDISSLTKPYKIISQLFSGGTVDHTLVTNSADFENNVPSGYKTINTANLPAPTVTKPDDYFQAIAYAGVSDTTLTKSTNFACDWVWIKDRSPRSHAMFDTVRGEGFMQITDGNYADDEDETNGYLNGFNISGNNFRLTDGGTSGNNVKGNGNNYVAWVWKAGGKPTTTNTSDSGSPGQTPTSGSVFRDGNH